MTVVVALLATPSVKAQEVSPSAAAMTVVGNQPPPYCAESPRTVGPAVGVAVSVVGFLGGSLLMASGVADLDGQRTAAQKGLIASGSIVMATSVAGVIGSSIKLHRVKREKSEYRCCVREHSGVTAAHLRQR